MVKYILLAFFICFVVYIFGRIAGRAAGRAETYEKVTIALLKIISATGNGDKLAEFMTGGVDNAGGSNPLSSSEGGGGETS